MIKVISHTLTIFAIVSLGRWLLRYAWTDWSPYAICINLLFWICCFTYSLSLPAELLGSVMELFNQVSNSVSTSMARFSYQNSTIPFVFKFWHSFYLRSTFVFKVRHLFLKVDVRSFSIQHLFLQLWRSFYSFEHSFFNFDVRFIQFNIHFSFAFQVCQLFYE